MTRPLATLTDSELDSFAQTPREERGFGALETPRGRLPLRALAIHARVEGLLSQVTVIQTFINTFSDPLEATYIFPLPERAAVTHFRMEVAGRIVEGELKERGQARQEYQQAIEQGHRAAITEEDRPGVFTLRVGNLMPSEEATIQLTFVGPLPYNEGEVTFQFPLVVAPRYIPGSPLPGPSVGSGTCPDTDAVPDASRITPPVLLPGFPNPVQLGITVEVLPAGLTLGEARSSLHAIEEERAGRVRWISIQPGERLNRDFILRFRVDASALRTALTLQPDSSSAREGTFLLTLVPPVGQTAPRPRDVVFILDRSGSMAGWKMVAARRALGRMVDTLLEQDRFTILAFDNTVETPPSFNGRELIPASDRHRFRAIEFLGTIEARGGTEMAQPLQMAVEQLTRTTAGRERILVLVTDGQVGNEDQLLKMLGTPLKQMRVFTLGIDQAVNAAFLQRLATLGGGHCELVESEDRLDEVMDQVHRRIGQPVLTQLQLSATGFTLAPDSVVPERLPDVFAGSPVLILGRYQGLPEGRITLRAVEATGRPWEHALTSQLGEHPALSSVWARGQVRKLEDRYLVQGSTELERAIVSTSLRFGVLCRFTAYVAVDRTAIVNPGGENQQRTQPVEIPQGWDHPEADRAMARGAMPAAASALCLSAAPPGVDSASPPRELLRRVRKAPVQVPPTPSVAPPPEWLKAPPPPPASPPATAPWDSEDEDSPRIARRPTFLSGLFELLLCLFPKKSKRKGKPHIDLTTSRQRAHELLEQLQQNQGGLLAERQLLLGQFVSRGQLLVEELTLAGVRSPELLRLIEVLRDGARYLESGTTDEAQLNALWLQLTQALQAFLGVVSAERSNFWK